MRPSWFAPWPSFRLDVLTLLALVVALALHADARGAGDTVSAEAPPVGPFSRVSVSGYAELVLVQGVREAVVVEASPKQRTRVRVRAADGTLSIVAGEDRPWWNFFGAMTGRPPTITVYFKTLETLSMNGAVKSRAASIDSPILRIFATGATSMSVDALKVNALHFEGAGAVKGEFAGSANEQVIAISGAGAFRAPKLVSESASVKVSGAGKVVVNAQKRLSAEISGAGAIDYYGDPKLTQQISGAGKIRQRGSADAARVRIRSA